MLQAILQTILHTILHAMLQAILQMILQMILHAMLQSQTIPQAQAIYRHKRYYRRSTDTGDTTGDARRDTTGDARRDTTGDARRDTTRDATVTDDTTGTGDLQAQAIYRHRRYYRRFTGTDDLQAQVILQAILQLQN